MPETEQHAPLDLAAIRAELAAAEEPQEGDLGTHRAIAARVAIGRHVLPLVDELEQTRREVDVWSWRSGAARGALARIVGLIPTGPLRNQVAEIQAELDRELFPDAAGAEPREGQDA